MDVNSIVTIIGSLGFPIAACLACFYYIKYTNDQHKEEIGKLTEAINNNTLVIQRLLDKMDMDDK